MAHNCKNCGQPALDTDTICWHCGQPLPKQTKPAVNEKKAATSDPLPATASLPLQSIAAYGGLTLLIIVILLAVMQALGNQPQVVQSLGDSLKPGWTDVTDYNRTFTLNLPMQWVKLDRYHPEQEETFIGQLRENDQYQSVLAVYDAIANDRQLLFLSQAAVPETAVPPFVLVTRSEQISQLTPVQMTDFMDTTPVGLSILRANLEATVNGREQVTYITTMPYKDDTLRCHQLFYKDEPASYLIIGCVSDDGYSEHTNIFHDILVSFQPLLR
jgi:hypothetical protein